MIERNHHDNEASSIDSQTKQEQGEFNLFAMLKPSIQKDGNQWCVLYGEDLQVGIAGFGNSPHLAIMDFNGQWYKSISEKPKSNIDTEVNYHPVPDFWKDTKENK